MESGDKHTQKKTTHTNITNNELSFLIKNRSRHMPMIIGSQTAIQFETHNYIVSHGPLAFTTEHAKNISRDSSGVTDDGFQYAKQFLRRNCLYTYISDSVIC